jgi:hypothetical protein
MVTQQRIQALNGRWPFHVDWTPKLAMTAVAQVMAENQAVEAAANARAT